MKIVNARYEIMDEIDGAEIIKKIERCGRVCYKSEEKITEESAKIFAQKLIRDGHESVLEHVSITVRFVVDRGVSHEIIRHRIAAFSQESTRYCNYSKDGEIAVVKPVFWSEDNFAYKTWNALCERAEKAYLDMIFAGNSPQQARSVLPNSLKTEIIMTADLREWRHFFKLRTPRSAHPQMREVTIPLLRDFQSRIPVIFDDIVVKGDQKP